MVKAPSSNLLSLRALVQRARQFWATRSLLVGAAATGLDVLVLLLCVKVLGMSNPGGAALAVTVGSAFNFVANRQFAFRDRRPELGPQLRRYVLFTAVGMVAHAWVVWLLADEWGVPVVLAKLAADVAIFSVGQLLVLRYLVFPRAQPQPATPSKAPPSLDVAG